MRASDFFSRSRVLGVIGGLALTAALMAAPASTEGRRFDIPTQSLDTALTLFGQQSDREIVFSPEVAKAKTAPAVVGELDPLKALEAILAGSGLSFKVTGDGTIIVAKPEDLARADAVSTNFKLAQAGGGEAAEAGNPEEGGNSEEGVEGRGEEERGVQLDEIVVTGTHIRGAPPQASPVYRYSREDIVRSGVSDLAGLMRIIPQNFLGGDLGATQDGRFGSGVLSAFNDSGAVTPNLRGLGSGSTLTLVNGHRLAPTAQGAIPDIGMIPISAIERVEILADGASAIYGADGVAGVVNIILRREFDGFGTTLQGLTDDGADYKQVRAGLDLGRSWGSGSALLGGSVNYADPLKASQRSFADLPVVVNANGRFDADLYPHLDEYSILGAVRQEVGSRVELTGDLWWGNRDRRQVIINPQPTFLFYEDQRADVDQGSLAAAIDVGFGAPWRWRTEALYTFASEYALRDTYFDDALFLVSTADRDSSIASVISKVDGDLFALAAGPVKAAAGIEYRREDYEFVDTMVTFDLRTVGDGDRSVKSAFGEVRVPLVSSGVNAVRGISELSVSASVRHDDYSDFGNATTYKGGVHWAITEGLALRGTYGTSFRAPDLGWTQREQLFLAASIGNFAHPDGGTATVLQVDGTSVLEAEESRALTFGVDFKPPAVDDLSLSLTWFDYDYTDRLGAPPFDVDMLLKPEEFGPLVTPVTAQAQVQAIIDRALASGGLSFLPDPLPQFEYIVDLSYKNFARQRVSGIDVTGEYAWQRGPLRIAPALSAMLLFEDDRSLTLTTSPLDALRRVGEQPGVRLRGMTSVASGSWSATAAANYTSGFTNQNVPGGESVDDWLTFDVSAQRQIEIAQTRTDLSVAIINLTDRNPPFVRRPFAGPYYDPANANPLGRYLTAQFTTRW